MLCKRGGGGAAGCHPPARLSAAHVSAPCGAQTPLWGRVRCVLGLVPNTGLQTCVTQVTVGLRGSHSPPGRSCSLPRVTIRSGLQQAPLPFPGAARQHGLFVKWRRAPALAMAAWVCPLQRCSTPASACMGLGGGHLPGKEKGLVSRFALMVPQIHRFQ